jgi:hypothetical protein
LASKPGGSTMSRANPYAGTVYEDIWAHGYAHGQYYPTDLEPTPPAPYDNQAAAVWLEGAFSGREDVQVNPPVHAPEHETPNPYELGASAAVHVLVVHLPIWSTRSANGL